jgi:hypothetical protein
MSAEEAEGLTEEQIEERSQNLLRKYERDRMKYYYAVIELDSIKTADHVYKSCDGQEIEATGLQIDLRYIPDGIEFPFKPKEVATADSI